MRRVGSVSQASTATRVQTELGIYLKRDLRSILPDHALRDDLGLDSMATIELLFRIEEAFDLQIPDEDLQNLVTVGDVVTYVEARIKPAKSGRGLKPTLNRPLSRKKA